MTEKQRRHRIQVCANKIHRLEVAIERFKRQLDITKQKKNWLECQVAGQLDFPISGLETGNKL